MVALDRSLWVMYGLDWHHHPTHDDGTVMNGAPGFVGGRKDVMGGAPGFVLGREIEWGGHLR